MQQPKDYTRGDLSLDDLSLDTAGPGWRCGFLCHRSNLECIEQPAYLCSCGERFASACTRLCPECGRFAGLVGEYAGIDCGRGPVIEADIRLCRACWE